MSRVAPSLLHPIFTIEEMVNFYTGRSSGSRVILIPTPSRNGSPLQWHLRGKSSPITAAGPRWLLTIFPIMLFYKHPYFVIINLLPNLCQH